MKTDETEGSSWQIQYVLDQPNVNYGIRGISKNLITKDFECGINTLETKAVCFKCDQLSLKKLFRYPFSICTTLTD